MVIRIFLKENGLTVKGHSGVAPRGEDLVCAGVSTLVHTITTALEEVAGEMIEVEKVERGEIRVRWDRLGEKGRVLLRTLELGLREMETKHPEAIEVRGSAEFD
ncbi:MAG: ribosomal-processing cysteine protease Prp [Candidatus Hydrogenedentota bacterium]|nr:MAG: ribosomal-processing cysteine protease Prp [Candidatus Hydrogenedentota bacterium]